MLIATTVLPWCDRIWSREPADFLVEMLNIWRGNCFINGNLGYHCIKTTVPQVCNRVYKNHSLNSCTLPLNVHTCTGVLEPRMVMSDMLGTMSCSWRWSWNPRCPLTLHLRNKIFVKVSQPWRIYLVKVLAFHKAQPEWMKPCKIQVHFISKARTF